MLAHHSPDPADDTDVLRSPWDITPTREETTRLWRLAGARREEESPGTVLAAAIEGLPINDVIKDACIWIGGACAAHSQGALDTEWRWHIRSAARRC